MLERAGVKMRFQDFVLLVIAGSLVAGAAGFVLSGPLLGVVVAIAVPVLARVVLNVRAGRRRSAFADQLDDSLQLIASSLRAGHSLLQAIASVAREAEEPTRDEFARILNETRVGRELRIALDETAARMASDDFVWVTQAIAINREVGGNLAEVLDGVGHTIRERNQIRGQVKALSAEGKMSAYVLMALPIGVVMFLTRGEPGLHRKAGREPGGLHHDRHLRAADDRRSALAAQSGQLQVLTLPQDQEREHRVTDSGAGFDSRVSLSVLILGWSIMSGRDRGQLERGPTSNAGWWIGRIDRIRRGPGRQGRSEPRGCACWSCG